MDILVAGTTGVIGRPAVRQLMRSGHLMRALAPFAENATVLRELSAEPAQGELWDEGILRDAVGDAR